MKITWLLVCLFIVTPLWLPGKDIVVKMAVKRGQTTVDPKILPLVCITVVLDHAALPVSEVCFTNTGTKDYWVAKVASLDATHPNVLTAMQGDHRSLVMLIVRLQPGRYEFGDFEFEGRNLSRIWVSTKEKPRFCFDVKPGYVNYVGSLVIGANWDIFTRGGESLPASITLEQTAPRDKKWATDEVPGLAGLPSVESIIERDEPNQTQFAGPIDVFFFGKQDKVLALFKQAFDDSKYHFMVPAKEGFVAPKPIVMPLIPIPKEVVAEKKVDKALVALIIDVNGSVIDLAVAEITDQRIVPSIKENIVRWKFHPAIKEGKPVGCLIYAPLEFKTAPMDENPGSDKPNHAAEPTSRAVH